MLMKLLVAFLGIALFKFLSNYIRYRRCKHHLKEYEDNLVKSTWNFEEQVPVIIELFKKASIEDSSIPFAQPAGYGYMSTGHASAFLNLSSGREDVVGLILQKFHRAIGVYRSRMLETLNPLYWVDFLIYLPRQIVSYLGVPPESTLIKVVQVVYWVLAPLVGAIYGLFKAEIDEFLRDFIISLTM